MYLQKQLQILFQNAQKQGQDIILSSPLLVLHYARFLIHDNLLDEALQILVKGVKTHPKEANLWILYSRVIYLVELLNDENEDCNTSPPSNNVYSQAIMLLMKACHVLPIKSEGHLSLQVELFRCLLTHLQNLSEDDDHICKVQQKTQQTFELVIFLQASAPPSSSSEISDAFKSYLKYITKKDGLKEGRKVYELVLYQAQLNSFPPEGMDDMFLECAELESNTKSKEENKNQTVRLRRMYDTIVEFFEGKGDEMKTKADWWKNKRNEDLGFTL